MFGVIDRFEEDFAVVQLDDNSIINIKKVKIPKEAKEGDVLEIDSFIAVNYKETEKRRKKIQDLTRDLWRE